MIMENNLSFKEMVVLGLLFVAMCALLALTSCETTQDPIDLDGKHLVDEKSAGSRDIGILLIFGVNNFGDEVCQIWDGVHGYRDVQPSYKIRGSSVYIEDYGVLKCNGNSYTLRVNEHTFAMRDYYLK